MIFSVKLKINKQRVGSDGYAALFFQVIIDSKKTTVSLDLKWLVSCFDEEKGIIVMRDKKDKDYHDYKMIIENKHSEINEILKFYRLSGKKLDIDIFKAEIMNTKSRLDFIAFWKTTIQERYDKQIISEQTRKNNNSSLKMLMRFTPSLLFKDIDQQLIENYQQFIRRQISPTGKHYRINSVAKCLTDLKFYLKLAASSGIVFDEPFTNIKIATNKGSITYLDKYELAKVWQYFHTENIKEAHKTVLRHFLFACFTGLRHSDLERISWREIKQKKELEFEPYKTRELQKTITVPLCENAFGLIETKKGNLFRVYVTQKSNVILKEIAEQCGIYKNLTTHVARHTFATQFLERGGKLEVLKELLGHTKIETTMIYVHVTAEQKRNQIKLLDSIFLPTAVQNAVNL